MSAAELGMEIVIQFLALAWREETGWNTVTSVAWGFAEC